eukprot:Gb_33629 [translate_table: standard]
MATCKTSALTAVEFFTPRFLNRVHHGPFCLELQLSPKRNARKPKFTVRAVAAPEFVTSKLSKVLEWEKGKRLQTQISPIAPDVTTIRSLDWDRDRFDMYGTTS